MGRQIIPVVEKYTELELILEYAEEGRRAAEDRHARQAGGPRLRPLAVIGRLPLEVRAHGHRGLRGLEELKAHGMEDCLKLLHFHLGSQITNIRIVKGALNEAARVYTNLVKDGAGLEFMDVGGGLGVDYDGSQTNFESSVNYTLQEYANDVVYHIQTVCDDAGVKHPTIVSESGRAIVGVPQRAGVQRAGVSAASARRKVPETVHRGPRAAAGRSEGDLPEPHPAQRARELSRRAAGARHGDEPVQRRLPAARAAMPGRERVLGHLQKINKLVQGMDDVPEELQTLDDTAPTPTSATSRCSSRFPTAGPSSSCSR
jgi:arginine decarboxylase